MNPPTNDIQLKSPAGHPELPYTPSCFQMFPQAQEGGIGWGPKLDGNTVSAWLTLPPTYDVVGQPNAYQTLEEYGLCVQNGQEVPFVKVEVAATQQASTSPLERLRQASQNVETAAPVAKLSPLQQRQQALEQQAAEPVDVQAPSPGGGAIIPLIAFGCIAAFIVSCLQDRVAPVQIPEYQVEEDLDQEVDYIQDEVPAISASPTLAAAPVRPDAGVYAGNPYSTGVSIENFLETGIETALETDRNSQKISRNEVETNQKFLETRVEMKFSSQTEVASLKNAMEKLEIRQKQAEINRKHIENGGNQLEIMPSISRNYTPRPEVVNALLAEIRSRTTKSAQPSEDAIALTKKEQEWGPKGCYEIDLELGTIANEEEAKLFCFDLIAEGETSTTKLMWRVFGVTGGTNKLYKSGYPQGFIAQWKQQFSEEA